MNKNMNKNINDFIKNICNKECGEYFEGSKEHTYIKIKESLPTHIFSKKILDREIEIKVARVASVIIKKVNKIDKNRFWILYYRLSEKLIDLKCNRTNLSTINKMMCIEYILDRVLKQIRAFDVRNESPPFQNARTNISQISKSYNKQENLNLNINSKKLKKANNYTKKILHKYSKDSIDTDTIKAIIENALIKINSIKLYQKKEKKSYIEKEVLTNFNKNEINKILHPILIELLHLEKFFNFIYNNFINSRFIDFTRSIKIEKAINKPIVNQPSLKLNEILKEYLDIIPPETKLILQLKIGERLNNQDFIKLIYSFNYKEIDILGYFRDEEILDIKFYVRNNIDIPSITDKKIFQIREKLKANSYINREDDTKRVILLKLIFSEEMNAKEIGVLLDYTDKQVYKKIERIKNKIKYKKGLTPCKEM